MKKLITFIILLLSLDTYSQVKRNYLSIPITISTKDSLNFKYYKSTKIGDSVINVFHDIKTPRISEFIWNLQIPFGYTYFVEIHNINTNKYKYIQVTTSNSDFIDVLDISFIYLFFDNDRLCIYFDKIENRYKCFIIEEK